MVFGQRTRYLSKEDKGFHKFLSIYFFFQVWTTLKACHYSSEHDLTTYMGLELLTQATLITRAATVIGNHRALANVIGENHV